MKSKLSVSFALFGLVLGILAIGMSVGKAYVVIWGTLPHNELTYSCGNPALAAGVRAWAAVSAIEDGGCTDDNPDITLRVVCNQPDLGGAAQPLGNFKYQITVKCEDGYPEDVTVMTHEVGHVLGLGHSEDPGAIMYWNPCGKTPGVPGPNISCNTMNADDIAGIQALYPEGRATAPPSTPTATPTFTPQPSATPTASATATATRQATSTVAVPTFSGNLPGTVLPTGTAIPSPTRPPLAITYRYVVPMIVVQEENR